MKHFTLASVRPGQFGFATGDDGTEYYIPRSVVVKEDISEDDVGSGFTSKTRANVKDDNAFDLIAFPFEWDDGDIIADLEEAISRAQELLATLQSLDLPAQRLGDEV